MSRGGQDFFEDAWASEDFADSAMMLLASDVPLSYDNDFEAAAGRFYCASVEFKSRYQRESSSTNQSLLTRTIAEAHDTRVLDHGVVSIAIKSPTSTTNAADARSQVVSAHKPTKQCATKPVKRHALDEFADDDETLAGMSRKDKNRLHARRYRLELKEEMHALDQRLSAANTRNDELNRQAQEASRQLQALLGGLIAQRVVNVSMDRHH